MSFRAPHELHKRRFSLNLGLGLVLAFLVAVVFGLTVAKVTVGGFEVRPGSGSIQAPEPKAGT